MLPAVVGLLGLLCLVSLLLPLVILFPFREPADLTPDDFGLSYERLLFETGSGAVLCGWFLGHPHADGATVVMLHGVCSNKSQMLEMGVEMYALGYNVLLLDHRRHGESSGRFTTYGALESEDLRCVIDHLVSRPDVSRDGVALIGYSMGGAVALQTLSHSKVQAVIADSAFSDLLSVIHYRIRQFRLPCWPNLVEWQVRRMAGFNLSQVCPIDAVRQNPKPVFLIHGDRDTRVPAEHSVRMVLAAPTRVSLWSVPAAAHLGTVRVCPREYYLRVAGFLAQHYQTPRIAQSRAA